MTCTQACRSIRELLLYLLQVDLSASAICLGTQLERQFSFHPSFFFDPRVQRGREPYTHSAMPDCGLVPGPKMMAFRLNRIIIDRRPTRSIIDERTRTVPRANHFIGVSVWPFPNTVSWRLPGHESFGRFLGAVR